jgi:hypothetical protein
MTAQGHEKGGRMARLLITGTIIWAAAVSVLAAFIWAASDRRQQTGNHKLPPIPNTVADLQTLWGWEPHQPHS